ncbi:hypothetical protein A4W74_04610 [Latilactobacillus curvatus]|uniref:hypothetical protein n=1 Tax=Latilactobacillus curvatus TaxID=28038 RepID=UPI0020A59189|nr:hypothetical protein [Latilactobacillus curvatus]UTB76006.1 hypothetical protein A4W74_04610 [Latilactobacillus curvatus]
MVFIVINSVVLFVIMQLFGAALSNLTVLESKYDAFSFSENKTTAGVNILYNAILPNIYILLLKEFSISDPYVNKLYFIVVGYLFIRYSIIFFVLQRRSLINIQYELALIMLVLIVTYIVFTKIIKANISVLIPIKDFKNEIMLILILFLYDVLKNMLTNKFENRDKTSQRERYIRDRYSYFFDKYNTLIVKELKDSGIYSNENKKKLVLLIYAIIIYENFSRPKAYRMFEYCASRLSQRKYSTGIMQVTSNTSLSDEESVIKGVSILKEAFLLHKNEKAWVSEVANKFNPSENRQYVKEIYYIYSELNRFVGMNLRD